MNIGIDIDGVLTDLESYIETDGKKYMIENNLGFDDTMNTNTIYVFLSKEDSHKFWDDGNKIIIITARTYDSQIIKGGIKRQQNMEELIIKWLDKNNIKYDKIVFSNLNKLKDCLNNKIDIMIEDSVSNIEQLKNHMKILCFNAKYNHSYANSQIYRVYDWDDVYSIISKI